MQVLIMSEEPATHFSRRPSATVASLRFVLG